MGSLNLKPANILGGMTAGSILVVDFHAFGAL